MLIRVTWSFEAEGAGMPSSAEADRMRVFENRLVAAVEGDLNSVLTAVITARGHRTWALYSRSVEEFSKALHSMPQEGERYPIEIDAQEDPEWSFLHDSVFAGLSTSR